MIKLGVGVRLMTKLFTSKGDVTGVRKFVVVVIGSECRKLTPSIVLDYFT